MLGCQLHSTRSQAMCLDPHPTYPLKCNNTTGESWLAKSCTSSITGRELARLQATFFLDQGTDYCFGHINIETNVIADYISQIPSEHALAHDFRLLLMQAPSLNGCQCFLPNAALTSLIVDILLQTAYMDPITVSRWLLTAPRRFTSSPGATTYRPPGPLHPRATPSRPQLGYCMLHGFCHQQSHNHGHADSSCDTPGLHRACASQPKLN